jgi:hypothetical protein
MTLSVFRSLVLFETFKKIWYFDETLNGSLVKRTLDDADLLGRESWRKRKGK